MDTRWACGAIVVNPQGYVIDSAPIFKTFRGQHLSSLARHYTIVVLQ